MLLPPLHPEETRRVEALRGLGLLDTPPEERFDRLTRLAAALFGAPIALVSLVDQDRQWFKSRQGLGATETGRDISFCGHAILGVGPFVVADASLDPRFRDNPLVTDDPRIRFYVGQPVQAPGGLPVGTLCVIDSAPHAPTPAQLQALADLGALVERELAVADLEATLLERLRLLRTEAVHQTMVEALHEGVILQQQDGLIAMASSRACEILGLTRDQMLGRTSIDPAWRCIHEDGSPWPGDTHPTMRTLATGLPEQDVLMGVFNPTGTLTWIRINTQPVAEGPEDLRGGVVCSFRDVTLEHLREQSLAQNEARFRLLVERTTDIIARHDVDGVFRFVTPSITQVLGYTPTEMIGELPTAFLEPEDVPLMVAAHRALLRGEQVGIFRFRARRKDGGLVWLETEGNPVTDPATGRITETVFTSRDISLRVAAEQDLRETTARHRAMMEALPDELFRQDAEGVYLDVHSSQEGLPYCSPESMVGRPMEDFLPPDVVRIRKGALRRALATGEAQVVEYQLEHEGRLQDFEARVVPAGPREAVTIVRDVTERNLLDRLKREFVSRVSHELRTPLTAIRGALGLLAGGAAGTLPEAAHHLLTLGQKNADRLIRLINDLLDLEQIQRGKLAFRFQVVELEPLAAQALALLRPTAEDAGVELGFHPPAVPIHARVDPDRLAQVLANLLSNAIKFSPPGGRVSLRLMDQAPRARLEVEDQGAGIPAGFRDHLFQPFSQADGGNTRQTGGTGLGLSISKALVDQMEGALDVVSEPGCTVFRIDLPQVQAPEN